MRGLVRLTGQPPLTIIVNTGDDEEFYGLYVSPDIDTVIYTLAGVVNRAHGWGLEGDRFEALGALKRFYRPAWFKLGDRDLATHLFRAERLRAGLSLKRVTAEIARHFGVRACVLPMSNDRVRTFVTVRGKGALPFQEYFVRGRARGVVERIEYRGARAARPLESTLAAIRAGAAVILAPSNPFVSLGPILALKGVRAALASVRSRVAAISPIVGDRPVSGPLGRMLRGLGHEVSALAIARLYADVAGVFVLDRVDRHYARTIGELGMRPVVADTVMDRPAKAVRLAGVVLRALSVYA